MCAPGHQFVNSENEEMIVEVKANLCNWVKKPEKFRTSTGFEPVTSQYRCDALPTDLWSHRRWEQVNIIVGSYVPVKEMSVNDNMK